MSEERTSEDHKDPKEWVATNGEECWSAMVDLAMSRGWDRDSAEDIAQEAWLTALAIAERDPERVRRVSDGCRWFRAMVRNIEGRWRRKHGRRERIAREQEAEIRETVHPTEDPDSAMRLLGARVLDKAEEILSPRQLEIVRHTLEDGMTTQEIAVAMEIAPATVRGHRRQLIEVLKRAFGDETPAP